MSKTIAQVNASPGVDTFQTWVTRFNLAANAISVECVTTNNAANGGLTTGNGYVAGIFGANTLTANTIRGGTVQTPAVLTLVSNVAVTGNTITLGTVIVNSTMLTIGGANVALATGGVQVNTVTTGTTAQQVDSWVTVSYRAADYTLTIKDNIANNHQTNKFLVIQDGSITDAHYVQYATIWSNTAQGDFTANANSTHVRVFLTPVSANAAVKGFRDLVSV